MLVYTGINTNDSIQTALQKIDFALGDSGTTFIFQNGIVQTAIGQPVELGGSLIKDTTISGNYTLEFEGDLQAAAFVTTGGTATQYVKGDGTLGEFYGTGGTSGSSGT